jgi:bifunctional non-homologous end joining protein LigD
LPRGGSDPARVTKAATAAIPIAFVSAADPVKNKLHSRAYDDDVFLYAFDLLELNGEDFRKQPLDRRKGKLEQVLTAGAWGLRLVEHMDGDGPTIFEHACKLKLEGTVSKRKDLGDRSGPSRTWLKVKNPASPAALRIIEENAVW